MRQLNLTPEEWAVALLALLLTFILYGLLYTLVGILAVRYSEGLVLNSLFTLPAFVPMFLSDLFVQRPGHWLVSALTLFPGTAASSLAARMALGEVPPGQIILALGSLILSALLICLALPKVLDGETMMLGWRSVFRAPIGRQESLLDGAE